MEDTLSLREAARKGPRILFFSGGTALRSAAHELTHFTHNTIHLITPFDSGGSSAVLRKAFDMPAVGDLRARIMALADDHVRGNPEICTLFAYRLARDASLRSLRAELETLTRGVHPLLKQVPEPMRVTIQEHLTWFARQMPDDFFLGGASIGNLVLAGGYLAQRCRIYPVIGLFSRMVRARGIVRPVTDIPAHLAVRLASGEVIVGQHRFTGKELEEIHSPIMDIWLTAHEHSQEPMTLAIAAHTTRYIQSAESICYPVGSFYSSLLANLLPQGVGRAVAKARCPKIFIPNLGKDPELAGHTLQDQVNQLLRLLLRDAPHASPCDVLTHMLVDGERGSYAGGIPYEWLEKMGVCVCHAPLVTEKSALADARLLSRGILQLVKNITGRG